MCISVLPGRQRIRIIMPPVTEQGNIVICIRKPPSRARTFDDADMDALLSEVNTSDTRRSQKSQELIDLYHRKDWKRFAPAAVKARRNIGAVGITGSGKAQPYDAKVLTPTGFRSIGTLSVGDCITTPGGEVVPVIGVFPQGEKQIFKVTFYDGRSVECCDDHLWKVWDWGGKFETGKSHATRKQVDKGARWGVFPLSAIKQWKSKMKRAAVPLVDLDVDFPPQDLPVPPYALGALLGDGCFGKNPSVRLSNPQEHIVQRVMTDLPDYQSVHYPTSSEIDHRITMKERKVINPLLVSLRSLGLMGCRSHEKFIPEIYKRGSVAQRVALLQGLMDTDGSVGNGTHATFTSTSEQLARGVQELAWSLGAIASIHQRQTRFAYKGEKKAGKPSWRVSIVMQDISTIFSLPKHRQQCTKKEMRHRLKIASIEPVSIKPAVCIAVGHPDGLYVTDNYVVTHNSDWLRRCVGACEERTASIESSPEIGNEVGPKNKVALFYNQAAEGRMAVDVVQATLQLYPKTIVFQEVTGKESFALLRAGLSGHQILTSWHAELGGEIEAMCGMLRQSNEMATTPMPELRDMVRSVFDIIMTFERDSTEEGEKFRVRKIWFRDIEEEQQNAA